MVGRGASAPPTNSSSRVFVGRSECGGSGGGRPPPSLALLANDFGLMRSRGARVYAPINILRVYRKTHSSVNRPGRGGAES